MRIIVGILALLIAPLANASLVRFDLSTDLVGNPSNIWLGAGPVPSSVDLTFTIDTLTAQSIFFAFGGINPGESCVQGFNVSGLQASNLYAITDTGATLWNAPSATVNLLGDNANGRCGVPGFFGGINVTDGATNYLGSPDFLAPVSSQSELFGSPDPLGEFFTSFTNFSGSGGFTGEFGQMFGAVTRGSIVYVPEPSSFVLLGAGLMAIAFRYRAKPRARSTSPAR